LDLRLAFLELCRDVTLLEKQLDLAHFLLRAHTAMDLLQCPEAREKLDVTGLDIEGIRTVQIVQLGEGFRGEEHIQMLSMWL
jgi:hypothetical protein